jgi:DNA mismatch repair protein MutS2
MEVFMKTKYLQKLEYYTVLNIVSSYAKTDIGKNLILNLIPNNDFNIVYKSLKETSEALILLNNYGIPPIDFFNDITISLKQLESGNSLSIKSLIDIKNILKMSRELSDYGANCDDNFVLNDYFSNLYYNVSIEKDFSLKILDENTISDKASNKLFSIRKEQNKLEQEIRNKLNNFIHSSTYSKYLQDPIVTIKNDRFVIPVKEEYRSFVKGFIHDVSSSGSTVFIEPTIIFELNTQISNLKIEENIEINRILKDLSNSLLPYSKEIGNNTNLIGYLDFIFTKAYYSKITNSIEPKLNKTNSINLVKARHPLIDESLVVPIDISIGTDFLSLLITGPNTGGKTASLKTVGLLCAMAQSGLHIPAQEGSNIFVFDNIFADIGDEQSISDSLSTFSAHILNIIEILKYCTKNSLILLDELGSGTDPIQGSKLAISILEYFYNLGAITICTTHYQELKEYALVTDGFENASFEFNIETLTPTYKLLLGIPGKSNAFEISEKLGLDKGILNRANSLMDVSVVNIEDLLKEIYDNKVLIEKQKEETAKNLNQIESLRKKLEVDYSSVQEKANTILENAKSEARDILLDAKDEATITIKNLKSNNSINDIDNLRNNLNKKIKEISLNNKSNNKGTLTKETIYVGMNVIVIPLNKEGTITSISKTSNNVEVQIGALKMIVNITDLLKSNKESKKVNNSKIQTQITSKSKTISNELNIIGLKVSEALPIVDKYLDNANLSSLDSVRIVHGKGTGKLREAVHNLLKTNPHVKSFRVGTFGEGEMGVTVVNLK